ncbi:MAG: peptide chain release factor N(5)-glutamine methyltransferase [Bacteroidales bacterium]|nr:peptide chain release factor N(5)-glutamine methyltransferase [Bacteroidales bacterium]
MFPMKENVKNIIESYRSALGTRYPDGEIKQITYLLFETFTGKSKVDVQFSYSEELSPEISEMFSSALSALLQGHPIQYILQKAWFDGMELKVTPDVLIPRQETEELCHLVKSEHCHRQNEKFSILDIGTGSGCIAIDLKKQFPLSQVTGIDISSDGLNLAKKNAQMMKTQIQFLQVDILSQQEKTNLGIFDVIVSNPPYVLESEKQIMNRNVVDFEPSEALFVPDHDPLIYYSAIAEFSRDHLTKPGFLYVEINEKFGNQVKNLFQSFGFEKIMVICDIHEKERMVSAVLQKS